VNIRLVCATNRDLEQSVQNGEFREDLLYRVNTIHIEVPPLRERKTDILELANFFLQKYAAKYRKNTLTFAKQTISKLENYAWPGNVRELQHAIEKAVILCDEDELLPSDFYMKDQNTSVSKIDTMSLEDAERLLISNSIKKNSANLSAVASELGITRPTLYSKIKKYGL